jgi:8-oxo-dGTP diphosphatase
MSPAYRNPKLTTDGIVRAGDGIVLVRRGRPPFEGRWALPGGFVDDGEDPAKAVLREVREETGLRARVTGLVGVWGQPSRDPRGHTVSIVYELVAKGEPRGGDDAAEARVMPLAGLPKRMAFDHARIVAAWRRQGSIRQPGTAASRFK